MIPNLEIYLHLRSGHNNNKTYESSDHPRSGYHNKRYSINEEEDVPEWFKDGPTR